MPGTILPSVLDDIRLPPGELATRDAIASTKEKELLGQTGDTFELTLLLTQTEALSYASHLAKVAGENEPQPDRARALAGVSDDMREFLSRSVRAVAVKNKIIADELDQRLNLNSYEHRSPQFQGRVTPHGEVRSSVTLTF